MTSNSIFKVKKGKTYLHGGLHLEDCYNICGPTGFILIQLNSKEEVENLILDLQKVLKEV